MRRSRSVTWSAMVCALLAANPARAQRAPAAAPTATRAAIDSFVVAVRDMAAWAIVTPAAHIPAGGLLDATGNVASVVSSGDGSTPATDSVLVPFRELLVTAARRQKALALGVGYLVKRTPPGRAQTVEAVMVEVEHASGYRADLLFPYTRNEFGEPVFGESFALPGTLRAFAEQRKTRGRRGA